MLVQYSFDLGRIDIEARADDQLLGAADDVKNVVFEPREIAGIEPAISVDHRCGRLGVPVIAAHDIGTANLQFADLAWRNSTATRLHQARLDPRDQRADGVVISGRLRPNACNRGGTFGDSVAVAQWQPEFRLDLGFQRDIEWRAGDHQPAKLAPGQLFDSGNRLVLKEPLISGWHAKHQRDAVIGDRRDERSGVEARYQMHSGAGHQ